MHSCLPGAGAEALTPGNLHGGKGGACPVSVHSAVRGCNAGEQDNTLISTPVAMGAGVRDIGARLALTAGLPSWLQESLPGSGEGLCMQNPQIWGTLDAIP